MNKTLTTVLFFALVVVSFLPSQLKTSLAPTTQAGILRWTRNGPYKPQDPTQTILMNDRAVITSASGLSSTIGDYNAVYAGTNGYGVYKSFDNGNTWQAANLDMDPSFDPNFLAMCWRDSSKLYAANGAGVLYQSIDSASSWRLVPAQIPGTVTALVVHPWDPRRLFAGVAVGGSGIYKSVDSGRTWQRSGTGLPTETVSAIAIAPSNSAIMYAGVVSNNQFDGRGLYRSTNGGVSWVSGNNGLPVNADIESIAVSPQDSAIVYVGLSNHAGNGPYRVYRSDDAGQNWQAAATGLPQDALILQVTVNPMVPDTVYVAAYADGVYKTTNKGKTWTAINSGLPTPKMINSVAVDYSGNFVFGGGNGVWNWQEGSLTPIDPPIPYDPPAIPTCPPSISSLQTSAPVDGLTTRVDVLSSSTTCNWQVSTSDSWITYFAYAENGQNPGGYFGSGYVDITVASNPGLNGRVGTIAIAGKTFRIYQDGTRAPYPAFDISGQVTDRNNNPLSGVRMLMRGSRNAIATTDSAGRYRFNITGGTGYFYEVTPFKGGVSFTPFNRSVSDPLSNNVFNFIAPAYEVCLPAPFGLPNLTNATAKIAYVRRGVTIWTMSSNGLNKAELVPEVPGKPIEVPVYSRDGVYLAFVRDGDIYVVNSRNGSGLTNWTQHVGDNLNPAWYWDVSAAGQRLGIVFSSNRTDGMYRLYRIAFPGGVTATPITSGDVYDIQPDVSPDGSQIAFVRTTLANRVPNIFTIDCFGNNLRQLTFYTNGLGAHQPRWSPDGKRLLYIGEPSQPPTVQSAFIMNANGSDAAPVRIDVPLGFPIPYAGYVGSASWAPDGNYLVISDSRVVYTVGTDGKNLTPIAWDIISHSPSWQWNYPIARRGRPFKRRPGR